jgi:hypothetical protein
MERHAERGQYAQERGEPGIAVLAEGFVKGFARNSSLACDGGHAASADNDSERLGDILLPLASAPFSNPACASLLPE